MNPAKEHQLRKSADATLTAVLARIDSHKSLLLQQSALDCYEQSLTVHGVPGASEKNRMWQCFQLTRSTSL